MLCCKQNKYRTSYANWLSQAIVNCNAIITITDVFIHRFSPDFSSLPFYGREGLGEGKKGPVVYMWDSVDPTYNYITTMISKGMVRNVKLTLNLSGLTVLSSPLSDFEAVENQND